MGSALPITSGSLSQEAACNNIICSSCLLINMILRMMGRQGPLASKALAQNPLC